MNNKVWPVNEAIYCQQLTSEYLEEALDLIETAFFPYENISTTLGIIQDPKAVHELRDLTRCAALDGVSVIAVNRKTNQVVGISLNKIQVKDGHVFENFCQTWKRPPSQGIVAYMASVDNLCDLFDFCQVDCLMELMFLATSPDCRKLGVGKKLTEVSLEIAKKLSQGVNVKKAVDGKELALEPVPKIASAIFTTSIMQKIGKECGFQIAAEKDYDKFDFRGLDFTNVVASGTKRMTLEYIRL